MCSPNSSSPLLQWTEMLAPWKWNKNIAFNIFALYSFCGDNYGNSADKNSYSFNHSDKGIRPVFSDIFIDQKGLFCVTSQISIDMFFAIADSINLIWISLKY